jgi:branched-chain amino acid transport system ATP-binding protein
MLDVQSVNVSYDDLQVLWNVSVEVNEGEIIALIGSNGAGKSTLLKTILSLLHPSSGSVTFLGERIDTLPAHMVVKKGISLVPEGRGLFPYMTVVENLMLGARSPKALKEMNNSIERAYEIFPALRERRKQLAKTLSGGEQQMLAISRALMANPKLLMLDEPSSGLGPLPTQKVFDVLRKINEDGTTILLVEQSVHHALELATTTYLLENGRVVLSGKREEILENEMITKAYLSARPLT